MTTKTRAGESQNYPNVWAVFSGPGGDLRSEGTADQYYDTGYETINYVSGRQRYNACEHVKVVFTPDVETQFYGNDADFVLSNYLHNPSSPSSMLSGFCASVQANAGMNVHQFAQRAIEAMTPSMESGFEITNFLYELRELPNLYKWWKRGRSFFKNWSSGSLNYSFGVLPFIGDAMRLHEGLSTFSERLNALKTGAGKPQVRHYSEVVSIDDVETEETVNGTDKYRTRLKFTEGLKYTATMRYTYQFPDLDRLNRGIYAFLDTMGAHLDAHVVWNAIPLTFVVDWFFNVSDFLKQFRKKWIPVSLYIKDFGISMKALGEQKADINRYENQQYPSGVCSQWKANYHWYHRFPLKVDDSFFLLSNTGSLTNRKLYLGALLLEQRISPRLR